MNVIIRLEFEFNTMSQSRMLATTPWGILISIFLKHALYIHQCASSELNRLISPTYLFEPGKARLLLGRECIKERKIPNNNLRSKSVVTNNTHSHTHTHTHTHIDRERASERERERERGHISEREREKEKKEIKEEKK